MVYTSGMKNERDIKTFTIEELKEYISKEAGKKINDAAIYKRINKLLESGELIRVGKGLYRFYKKSKYDYSFEHDETIKIIEHLQSIYSTDIEYIIYESIILNEFLNHLLAHSVTIVEAPKFYAEHIFWKLQEGGFNGVMLNPTDDQRYRYNPSIIVKSMVTKAPINLKEHKITIEKLVVDIVCDKLLNQFYEGAEKPFMLDEIFKKYTLKYDSIKNYAKRRNVFDELMKYVPEEERIYFNDQQINIHK